MEFRLPNAAENDEHIGVGFVKKSKIFVMQNAIFFVTEPFDSVYYAECAHLCPPPSWFQRIGWTHVICRCKFHLI